MLTTAPVIYLPIEVVFLTSSIFSCISTLFWLLKRLKRKKKRSRFWCVWVGPIHQLFQVPVSGQVRCEMQQVVSSFCLMTPFVIEGNSSLETAVIFPLIFPFYMRINKEVTLVLFSGYKLILILVNTKTHACRKAPQPRAAPQLLLKRTTFSMILLSTSITVKFVVLVKAHSAVV